MFDFVIQNGTVATPQGRYRADIGIYHGKTAAISGDLSAAPSIKRLALEECSLILPGCIDAHQHLWEPGMVAGPDFADGSRASLAGGVTTIIDQPLSPPEVLSPEIFQRKRALGEKTYYIDFALHAGVSPDNFDKLHDLWKAGCTAFKIFTCESGTAVIGLNDGQLLDAFRTIGSFHGTAMLHCENDDMLRYNRALLEKAGRKDPIAFVEWRTAEAEAEAIHRVLYLARGTGVRIVILHTTVPEGVEMVQEARRQGSDAWVETCPHNLYLSHEDLRSQGPWVTFAPPVRDCQRVEKLWEQLSEGKIDFMGSDPGTIDPKIKQAGEQNIWDCQYGLPEAETYIPLMLNAVANGWITLERLVLLTSKMPAQVYGLYPRKGTIQIGSDADFTIVDLAQTYTLRASEMYTSCGWIPYEGKKITGKVTHVILSGKLAAENGIVLGNPGDGRFIARM